MCPSCWPLFPLRRSVRLDATADAQLAPLKRTVSYSNSGEVFKGLDHLSVKALNLSRSELLSSTTRPFLLHPLPLFVFFCLFLPFHRPSERQKRIWFLISGCDG
ncbi:hypothetical protein IE53DRAFT_263374 [Violaceomyces palustris]|uniref:Uncharacterized protein n=1 Tax=Violaceomyces palustris TaxID=1673888 RepID=A0ACD0P3I4_9BASI|nr:hypothetical protein IE53DRAFT_263374 [Violaceomyces palustris]